MQSEMGGDGGSCAAGEPFALQVLGDDMEPEFEHGVIIVVDPEGVVENGCYVVAVVNEEYIFRQLVWDEDKRYFLKPLNDAYETVAIPNLQGVKGVVVQKAGRRRSERKHYV
jgi:DNA polymerase V